MKVGDAVRIVRTGAVGTIDFTYDSDMGEVFHVVIDQDREAFVFAAEIEPAGPAYRITRRERERIGKDAAGVTLWAETWRTVKTGLSKERAEELLAMAKTDYRTVMHSYRVEEEGR